MPWAALFGIAALILVQIAVAGACLYAYTRLRHAQDTAGQEKISWGVKVEAAVTQADTARRLVESIEVEHYKRLRSLVESLNAELTDARARIVSLERELKVCQTKLASEERIARRDEQRRAERTNQVVPAGLGEPDADSLVHLPGVIPLGPTAAPAAATAPAKSNFGRPAYR